MSERILLYGTGPYCRYKISGIDSKSIVAFVDRKAGEFMGRDVYPIEKISSLPYDKIIVLSRHFLRIIPDLIDAGVPFEKIIPGINIKPRMIKELEITGEGNYKVMPDGSLQYHFKDGMIDIKNDDDFDKVRNLLLLPDNIRVLSLMNLLPVSKTYGADRGGSIVRYYIDDYLSENQQAIKGDILEIGDDHYTKRFMKTGDKSFVMKFAPTVQDSDYCFSGNLINGDGFNDRKFDCIIMTQVLNFVENIEKTPEIVINALKPGGCALITVSGITPICRADMEDYGQYWCFTDRSIKNMFERSDVECSVITYGNLKSSCLFLAGMGCDDISREELDYRDVDYQLVIAVKIMKK